MTDAGNDVVVIKKGEILYSKGEECSSMYILHSGSIGLYLNYGEANQYELAVLDKNGSSLGEMGLLQHEPRNGTAVALADSVLVEIDSSNFQKYVATHPEMAVKIIQDLSLRFKNLAKEYSETKEVLIATLTEQERRSLKGRLKRAADILLGIPEGVPADLYMDCYARNHNHLV